ncbi:MAG TPA: low molecular weight protein-tyrosine-phosphatase [Chitinophagales bacterium]|nr:low molecular weight protein-tyrosine-phosphatase [Chitinophagales bacterium]
MKILFVCLGNICRSPMAEGIMKKLATQNHLDWYVDSAGTEYYHVGEQPDRRAIRTSDKFGVDIAQQRARRISKRDFEKFDVIYSLADDVLEELLIMKPAEANGAELKLLLDELYPHAHRSVPDPYYDDEAAFEPVFKLIEEACAAIVVKYAPRPEPE